MSKGAAIINITQARLPAAYQRARAALEHCAEVDEVANWRHEAAAISSYALQKKDRTLFLYAERIKLRAERRYGELLRKADARGRPRKKVEGGTLISQRRLAEAAGIFDHQTKAAVRLALVPREAFEQAIESDNPTSVRKLAARQRRRRRAPPPRGFVEATRTLGALHRLSDVANELKAELVAEGVTAREIGGTRRAISAIIFWLRQLDRQLARKGVP